MCLSPQFFETNLKRHVNKYMFQISKGNPLPGHVYCITLGEDIPDWVHVTSMCRMVSTLVKDLADFFFFFFQYRGTLVKWLLIDFGAVYVQILEFAMTKKRMEKALKRCDNNLNMQNSLGILSISDIPNRVFS